MKDRTATRNPSDSAGYRTEYVHTGRPCFSHIGASALRAECSANDLVTTDSTVGQIIDLLDIPLRTGSGPSVYLRDVGTVSDSSDILAGYALLNDKRTVYIPVTKRPDASTITVVNEVRASLPRFQSLIPEDIKISYEFDESQYVPDALLSVLREGLLGALLTGLTLLFFCAIGGAR